MTVRVINLDRHVERLRRFLVTNAHVLDIVRASGVDEKSADREASRKLGVISAGLKYSGHNLGCALSHNI
jgi:GR25 family glycosyltransferase involved in LPS biosynthesis